MATPANPYATFLGNRDALAVLNETPVRLQELVEQLGEARMNESYAPGKWTLNTVVCHLADCELAFGYRWRQVVAQAHHVIQPFDQDSWATHYASLDGKAALAAFCANRMWSVNWLRTLTPAELAKKVSHPERGELTLHQLLQLTAGHDLNHLGQFEKVAAAVKAGQ
jgi:uncharacterized damage-inducible protein DinB